MLDRGGVPMAPATEDAVPHNRAEVIYRFSGATGHSRCLPAPTTSVEIQYVDTATTKMPV